MADLIPSDDSSKVRQLADLIKQLGVPVVLLFMLLYYMAAYVLNPLIDRQIRFMDSIESTNRIHALEAGNMSRVVESITKSLQSIEEQTRANRKILEDNQEILRGLSREK